MSAIVVEFVNLDVVQALLTRLANLDEADLLTNVGGMGEMQTRRRIEEEKTAPDGAPWPPTEGGTRTLMRSGDHLHTSIRWVGSGSEVQWGSDWEHAHVHQDGAVIVPKGAEALVFNVGGRMRFARKVTIPAREFVGISAENAREIEGLVTDYLGNLLG